RHVRRAPLPDLPRIEQVVLRAESHEGVRGQTLRRIGRIPVDELVAPDGRAIPQGELENLIEGRPELEVPLRLRHLLLYRKVEWLWNVRVAPLVGRGHHRRVPSFRLPPNSGRRTVELRATCSHRFERWVGIAPMEQGAAAARTEHGRSTRTSPPKKAPAAS